MSDSRTSIGSIAEAIEKLQSLEAGDPVYDSRESPVHKFPFGLWFRGHSTDELRLEPLIFRRELPKTPAIAPVLPQDVGPGRWDETNVYEHLKLRVPRHENTYHTAFDWLCLMQHYSVPTRLLDWSESILPALYFAVKEFETKDGELIVLNSYRLNAISKPRATISSPDDYRVIIRAEMATTRSSRNLRTNKNVVAALEQGTREERTESNWQSFRHPIAVFPRRLNDRMSLQSSVFTVHGGKYYPREVRKRYKGELLPLPISLETINKKEPGNPILKRYCIPSYRKKTILCDLFRLGVHEASLFPEVDRQATYLQHLWWYPIKP